MLRFFRKFACFSRTGKVPVVEENGEDNGEIQQDTPASAVPVFTRTVSRNIDIPIPSQPNDWWLSDHVPTRPSHRTAPAPKRLITRELPHYVNESRLKAHEIVPISQRTTEEIRSDDSSITQISTDSQAASDLQEEVPQPQNTTSNESPAILPCNEQPAAPRATLIKIGIILRSRDGSIPRVVPLNPQQNLAPGEALIKAALCHEELGRNGDSTCESHILYNTQSGKVELSGGHFEQEYII
ncbi:uncharacterized protein LOC118466782 [Anopheles albimanus]|uniref:uncharacterized protein LOC118466782 n=1 Tax=Anopheles albimanus TaxID=7167 RepID=UPI00163F1B8E|nr:uncharacterized protein LOC118466782 [Anopheles albimanus]